MTGTDDFDQRLASFNSARFRSLRPAQKAALAGYDDKCDQPDIAIELPTGFGKTLVALLIGDQALENGKSVAYLTGTNQLADQVLNDARDLPDMECVRFSSKNYPPLSLAAYHDAQAIAVMNYWTYFNSSPKMEPADVLIFDDAHLAEQPLAGMFALRIDRRTQQELYDSFCDLVLAHSDLYPTVELMRSGEAGPTTAPELLAFNHWVQIQDSAAALLSQRLPSNDRNFIWPTIRPSFGACGVLIGPSAIEIRPYHPPTQSLPGYQRATQRVYLSATLGTSDDLQRRLGVAPVVNALDESAGEEGVGRRLFLLVGDEGPPLTGTSLQFALDQAGRAGRTAWLCASHAEADLTEAALAMNGLSSFRLRGGSDDTVLDRWASHPNGHLVTAGRFDGLDLPGDVCRLVVLPSVPAASTEFERFVMAYLGDATFMRHRVGQRVTQALGRANRDADDWAMYLGLSSSFGTLLAQTAVRQSIPAEVRPVVDDALDRAERGWGPNTEAANHFWSSNGRDPSPIDAAGGSRTRPGRRRAASTAGSANDEVTAVTLMWRGDYERAALAAGEAANALQDAGEIEHAAFWQYVAAQALFLHGGNARARAIDSLRTATESGAHTAWFVRLSKVLAELRGEQAAHTEEHLWTTWDEWIRRVRPAGVRRAIERCRAGLVGTHDQQAEALEILGRIAGAGSDRPSGTSVTDAIWTWPHRQGLERRLWEVKTGDADALPRGWVDQSLGQIAAEPASDRKRVVGCIMTQLDEVSDEAAKAASDSICIVSTDAVVELATRLSDRLTDYIELWGEGSATERGVAREQVEARLPSGSWLSKLLAPSKGAIVRREDVVAAFK